MAQAGVAYVEIRPDWAGFNREMKRQAPQLDRQFSRMGGQLGGQLAHGVAGAGKQAGLLFAKSAAGAATVGAVGLATGFAVAISKAANFEQQMSALGSVSSASAKEMEALRSAAIKAGADTKFSALEAAKAQTELAKGGLATSQILEGGLSSALALAAAGELELADAASTTVNAMKLFKIRGKDSVKVADALATAANSTTADVSDFALALNQAGSAAKTVGLSFPETITALEALAEVGIKGSDAGTSLKTALVQLASPTSDKAVETAKKLGINVFDAKGNIKSLVDVSKELRDGLGGLTKEQRISAATTLVGQDGFRALLALYDAGPKKIGKLQAELTKQGTAAKVAKEKQDNLKGSLEQLTGSLETVGVQVGTLFIPAIRKGADELTDFTGKISKIIENDKLDLGEKLSKSFDVAKVELDPWLDKLKAEIIRADIPGEIGDILSGGSDRIGQGFDGSPFIDKFLDQVDQADLPQKLGDLISEATPVIASAAAGAGLLASGAFVKAFLGADVWGRLALGAWLLSKMGGPSAFRKIGATAGTNMAIGAAGVQAVGAAVPVVPAGPGKTYLPTGRGFSTGSPVGPAGSAPGLKPGNPLGVSGTQIGKTMGTQMGQAIPPAVQASGVGGKLSGVFRGYGPLLAASVGAVFGPELVRILDEKANPVAAYGLPKTGDAISKGLSAAIGRSLQGDLSDMLTKLNPMRAPTNIAAGITTALGITESSEEKLRSFGDTAGKTFDRLKAAGDVDGMRKLAEQARAVARDFPAAAGALNKFADDVDGVRQPTQAVEDAIDRMASGATGSIKNLRTNVRLNTRLIKNALSDDPEKGREALARSFRAAVSNIETSMAQGTIKTKEGTAEIERLMVAALSQFGFSKEQALNIAKTGDADGNKGREGGASSVIKKARGGPVFGGAPTGDSIPALLERDEYVLNRKAVKKIGRRALDAVNFGAAPRFQVGGIVQRFAGGGSVTGDTDFLPAMMNALRAMSAAAGVPIFVQSGRRTMAEQAALAASKGIYGPGNQQGAAAPSPNAPHVRGVAADITPGSGVFGRLASKFGLGFNVPGEPWHIALLDAAMAGAADVSAPELKRLLVSGPDSPLKSMVQGAMDTTRAAAQQVVEKAAQAASFANGAEASVPSGSASGNGSDLMRQISKQRGWNFSDWWALDAKESSHGANLSNPTSTARLRGQFLDMNWGKYGPGSDPRQNPSMAQQIQSMADYIAERYGNPTSALGFHNANNFYQRGGIVDGLLRLAPGGPVKGLGAPKKGIPAPLPGGIDLGKMLGRITTGRTPKLQYAATGKLLSSIEGIGFTAQANTLAKLAGDSDLFGEYADRASRLTDSGKIQEALEAEAKRLGGVFPADAQQAIVDQLLGRVGGGTQLDWLTKQLGSLFGWRNVIADTDPIVTKLRDDTATLLKDAEARLVVIAAQIKKAEGEYRKVEKERDRASRHEETLKDKIRDEMDKPAKKRNQDKLAAWREDLVGTHSKHVALNQELANMRGEKRTRERLQDDLTDKVIPALTNKRDALEDSHGDLLGNLIDAQGLGGPTTRLGALPPLGVLGGKLFDVQSLIQDLTDNPPRIDATTPAADDNQQQRADILADLLREANQRTAVSEATFDVFKSFPYGGAFKDGGIVPGPVGAPTMILAHGGEEVVSVGDTNGGGGRVRVVMEDHRTRVFVDDVEQIVETYTRRQARKGARGLPGVGGGNIR